MIETTAVVSLATMSSARYIDGHDLTPTLKRAAIMCDRIFLHDVGLVPLYSGFEDAFLNRVLGAEAEHFDLMNDGRFSKALLRPDDFGAQIAEEMHQVGGERYGQLLQPAWRAVTRRAETDPDFRTGLEPASRKTNAKDWMKLSAELAHDLQLPVSLARWVDHPIGIISHLHNEVLAAAAENSITPFGSLTELANARIVDFGTFTWSEILDLRAHSSIYDLRLKLRQIEAETDSSAQQRLFEDGAEFFALHRPKPTRTLVTGILGNLPIAPFNPLSIASAAHDYFRDEETVRRYGWLFFIFEARAAHARSESRASLNQ
jgi:hypothetical protein